MDYFLIAIIDKDLSGAQTVSLRLFNTRSQDLIKEQLYADNRAKSVKEENEEIKRTIGLIAAQLK